MNNTSQQIAENLNRVRQRISLACDRAGRDPQHVQLVCVTKYARPEWIECLLECGQNVLGESRPQQLEQRAGLFPAHIQWHLLGQLQRNKVRRTLAAASVVHSVDSLKLLDRIETIAIDEGRRPKVLLQVNLSGDSAKHGFTPESLDAEWPRVCELRQTHVAGLMTMAHQSDDLHHTRTTFETLRNVADRLGTARVEQGGEPLSELSMGMSNDFEIAVEAGATLVRIGRTLFEGLADPSASP